MGPIRPIAHCSARPRTPAVPSCRPRPSGPRPQALCGGGRRPGAVPRACGAVSLTSASACRTPYGPRVGGRLRRRTASLGRRFADGLPVLVHEIVARPADERVLREDELAGAPTARIYHRDLAGAAA